ncbi:MAG: serine hydrolase domain-containing protein [Chloroflexota bacterium]
MHPIEAELKRVVDIGLPGAFVYTEDADGTSQFFTEGYANLATQQRMTPTMHYRVGSTTKTFTAVVALQLMAEGKLALSDTLAARLPDLPAPNADVMTIEHLMRMRSGLFDFEDDSSLLGDLDAHLQPISLQHVLDLTVKHPAEFTPGEKFTYCNSNFCILERIIERITGNMLGQEFERRIFKPLGLENTSYPSEDDLGLPEPYIHGYERTVDGWRECSHVFFGRGDGALISTAVDLGKFFRALLIERRLVSADWMAQIMSVIEDNPPADEKYGLGLMAYPTPCATLWGHAGGGFGYGNLPYMRQYSGRFAILMLNGTYGFRLPTTPNLPRPRFSPEFRASLYCE